MSRSRIRARYFAADGLACVVVGSLVAIVIAGWIPSSWSMWAGMFAGMALGMVLSVPCWLAASPLLGMIEPMLQIMLVGMVAGMAAGMVSAQAASPGLLDLVVIGAGCGTGTFAVVSGLDCALRWTGANE